MSALASHRTRARWLALAGLWLAAACSERVSGPLPIAWGREPCAHCSMAIGEPRFAAELRLGPREVLRFDDFGCAVAWLAEHADADPPLEAWVMDQDREGGRSRSTACFMRRGRL